jgi:iron complex transport system ATP-binding protein
MGRVQHVKMFFSMTSFDQLAVDEAMDRVGVSHFAQRPFLDLSGGEKQLVLIARAIATGCSLLLLDEPFAGLDMDNQCRILSLLRELASDPGLGVLFSSHEPNHLFAVADRSLILKREATALLGPCAETLNAGELTHVYGIEIRIVEVPRKYITTKHAIANFNT